MAETPKGKSAQAAAEEAERLPTKRMILKRERVIVLPEEIDAAHAEPLLKVVKETVGKSSAARISEAWIVVDEAEGTVRSAIEAHAGEPGTPDARPGDYKAPPARGWMGGERYVRPPKPKVERLPLED
jgi:hypothetical protein